MKTIQAAGKVGRLGVALAVGLGAALAGGVLWALLAIWTETEYGWIAWALGGLVGLAVRLTTRERTVRVGIAALLLAVLGLGIGKVIMTEYFCRNYDILPVKLKKEGKFNNLPDNLKEIAVLRLENPEASLTELGAMLKEPIGKSGVNYRLKALMDLAQ